MKLFLKIVWAIGLAMALFYQPVFAAGTAYEFGVTGTEYRFDDAGGTQDADGYGVKFKAGVPLSLGRGTALTLGMSLQYTRMDWGDVTLSRGGTTYALPEDLAKASLSAALRFPLNRGLMGLARVQGTLASDLEDISGEDFSGLGMVSVFWLLGKERRIGLGAGYSEGLNDSTFFPVVTATWRFDSQWIFRLNAPRNISMGYPVTQTFEAGAMASLVSNSYRMTEDAPFNSAVFSMKEIFAGVYGDVKLAQFTTIRLQAGVLLDREIELTDEDDEDITLADRDADNAPIVSLAIRRVF